MAVDGAHAGLAAVARDERGFIGAGHVAGQNIDVRLTAQDGYQAERSYAIAWASESAKVALTVEPAPARRPRIFVCGPTAIVHESKRIRVEEFGPMGG